MLTQFLTPTNLVPWLAATDDVRDAFDHLETHDLTVAPLVDAAGRYAGVVTEADLRRHLAGKLDRATALATKVSAIERRAHYRTVTPDQRITAVADEAANQSFVPVVDAAGRLVGIIDRRHVPGFEQRRAA